VCKGDIVIALNSSPITCQEDYAQALYSYLPGTAVSITVYRDGRNLTLRATVAEEGAF
jgi:S1-C subfamily serine protease